VIGECWEVDRWSKRPEEITIIRETEKTAILEKVSWHGEKYEERIVKTNRHIFPTWEKAKEYMIQRAEESLAYAKREVDAMRSELENAKALKKEAAPR